MASPSSLTSSLNMVDFHLLIDGSSMKLLSIPNDEIEYLAVRPLKWICFTIFCICGAQGHVVSGGPNGPVVDYESTSLSENTYHYIPNPGGMKLSFLYEIVAYSNAFRGFQVCRPPWSQKPHQRSQFRLNVSYFSV